MVNDFNKINVMCLKTQGSENFLKETVEACLDFIQIPCILYSGYHSFPYTIVEEDRRADVGSAIGHATIVTYFCFDKKIETGRDDGNYAILYTFLDYSDLIHVCRKRFFCAN